MAETQQTIDNANAIAAIIDNSKNIDGLPLLTSIINLEDKIALYRKATSETVKMTVEQLSNSVASNLDNVRVVASVIWIENYDFDVIADYFPINDSTYSATAGVVTLDAADATLFRKDLIGVFAPVAPATIGVIGFIKGTTASESLVISPDYDQSLFYPIKEILVSAATTQPVGVVNDVVFDEGTEWTPTLTANLAITTSDPSTGTKSIEATNSNASNKSTFLSPVVLDKNNLDLLTFDFKLKEYITGSIFIKFFNGSTQVSDSYFFRNGVNGFNNSLLTYQTITIDGSLFNFTDQNYDTVQIFLYDSTIGYFLDNIQIRTGSGVPIEAGTANHELLSNIGVNSHPQIDTHISDETIHFIEGKQKVITATTYTILDADFGFTLIFDNATGCLVTLNTLTVPNFECGFINKGVGDVDFVNGTATATYPDGTKLLTDKVAALIREDATTEYTFVGSLGSLAAANIDITDALGIFIATEVEEALQEVKTATDLNTTHSSSDGKDHSDVVLNNAKLTADATNVNAAGATMNNDVTLVGNGYFLDDDTMVGNDATKVASQQSIVAYVTSKVASAIVGGVYYQGAYNASTNSPDLETPSAGVVFKGFMWTVTVAGDFFTEAVQIGDVLIAEIDDPTVLTDWTVVQSNLDAASIKVLYESNANTNEFDDAEQTKLSNISISQPVNLDTIESDTATNNAKVGITPTQASDITTNNAKVSNVISLGDGLVAQDITDIGNLSGINTGDQVLPTDFDPAGTINYVHPTTDGSKHVPANSTTNDGKVLTASAVAGVYTWEVIAAGASYLAPTNIAVNTTAVSLNVYVFTADLTLTLPITPTLGDKVKISNMSGVLTCVIARNGQNIVGLAEDLTIDSLNIGFELIFTGATKGWVLT